MTDMQTIEQAAPTGNFIRKVFEDLTRMCEPFRDYRNDKGDLAAFVLVLSFITSFQTVALTHVFNDSTDESKA